MDNKQTIIDNNARIEAITNRLNSSTFVDVRDTTATAADVATGKIFYDKDGVRTEGSGEIKEFPDMLQARVDATNSCRYLFYYYDGPNVDFLENLDTSKVTDMSFMFYSNGISSNLTAIPQLDTNNVTSMVSMFNGCSKLNTIPQLDTSKVTNMQNMFNECRELTAIPQLDTSNVTVMSSMFYNCAKLTAIPQLDISKVNNMQGMFYYCLALTVIPELDTSNVTNITTAFRECRKLTTIPLLDIIKVTSATNTFYNCQDLTNLTLKNIKISLQIGSSSGTIWGSLLTLDSLINTIKELWDYSSGTSTYTLTMGTTNLSKLTDVYVKLIDVTDEMIAQDEHIASKKPCVVCESTDEGAMTITEYALSKKWNLA